MVEATYMSLDLPSYKAWCKQKGYHTDSIFDAVYALFFWPLCFFMPNPENARKREYRKYMSEMMKEEMEAL